MEKHMARVTEMHPPMAKAYMKSVCACNGFNCDIVVLLPSVKFRISGDVVRNGASIRGPNILPTMRHSKPAATQEKESFSSCHILRNETVEPIG